MRPVCQKWGICWARCVSVHIGEGWRLTGRLQASSDCAPCFPFGKARCSAWLHLTAHRASLSGKPGVPVGLFSINSPQDCLLRNARPSGLRPSEGQSIGLFIPKRSTFRASPLRGAVHRTVYSETLDLQGFAPPRGGPLDCLFRNAHASGLRPPCKSSRGSLRLNSG